MSIAYPSNKVTAAGNYSNVTIGAGASASTISITGAGSTYPSSNSVLMANGTGTTWATNAKTVAKGRLHLEGEDADLVMNGVSLRDMLNGITDRLAILQPKPELLEKYANLREAYEHYKTLEALLHEDSNGQ